MAIDRRKRRNGVKYRSRMVLPSGKRISQTFDRKVDAEKFEAEIRAGLRKEESTKRLFFFELCKQFEEIHLCTLEFSTQQRYQSTLKIYLVPRFGETFVDQITKFEIAQFVAELHKTDLSGSSKNFIFIALQSVLKRAVEWGYIGTSPAAGIKPPRKGEGCMSYWTKSEIKNFLSFHQESKRLPLYLIALNTGMRLGEILGLCWDCVDFENGLLLVRRTWCQKSRKLKDDTKAHKARRVGINPVLRECLLELRKRRSKGHVLSPEDLGCRDASHASRWFRSDCKVAKVSAIRFHDLRHTFATQFVASGGSIHALSGILGHSTEAMTARYAHFGDEHARAAAKVVSFGVEKLNNVVPFRRTN